MTMTPEQRRAALIDRLRPTGDGTDSLYRFISREMSELGVWSGGDGALENLARAATCLAYQAAQNMTDVNMRGDVLATLIRVLRSRHCRTRCGHSTRGLTRRIRKE
jgi:hypothetical protein